MLLWTIQPEEIWNIILKEGVYRCDPEKCEFLQEREEKLDPKFTPAYSWLADQMDKRVGKRPEGVQFPVWAWYQYNCKRKPDLRRERWENGYDGERFACIELEIPDKLVLLSDFHMWHFVLNRWPISDTEEESNRLDSFLDNVEQDKAEAFLRQNWERVFDITPFKNEWTSRGEDIQATFWELKYEYVKRARFFSAARKWKGTES